MNSEDKSEDKSEMNSAIITHRWEGIDHFSSLSVIGGYYMVLGGGRLGADFARYAKANSLPFVVILDIDRNSEASHSSTIIDRSGLLRLIKEYSASNISPDRVYFHCMDISEISVLLEAGIPEYIVPAVPSHAVADIAIDMLGSISSRPLISRFNIDEKDDDFAAYFHAVLSSLPREVVTHSSVQEGMIMLSYALPGEICPANCACPENYCYNFKRKKHETITTYVRKLLSEYNGWVFESYQMKEGIGGIRGQDLKKYMLSLMDHVWQVTEQNDNDRAYSRYFFIATTCNCHGIVNILYVL